MATNTLNSSLMKIVQPLFAEAVKVLPDGSSIPAVVLENRKNRALGRMVAALESRGSASLPRELRAEVGDLLMSWSRALFDDGFKPVESFEVRCANERDLVLARESGDRQLILAALERDLRRRIVERFGRIEIRGIQTSERVLLDLDRIFIPSHVEAPLPCVYAGLKWFADPFQRVPVVHVLKHHSRLLIVGPPGSGKSTLVAWLASQLCGGRLATEVGWPGDPVPLVLTVREFTSPSITRNQIARLTATDAELIGHLLTGGRAVLLVDGLDEVPVAFGEELLDSLKAFSRRHSTVSVIVTSRPTAAVRSGKGSLPGFELTRQAAMTGEEAEEFVDKWCLAAEESLNRDPREAKANAVEAAKDLKQRIARSRPIQRLVETPLIASIVCIVHRFLNQRVPEHRVALYEKCTDVLLYEWDKAKLPAGSLIGDLTAPQKRMLLSGLAQRMHEAQEAEWPDQEVRSHFAEKLPGFGYRAADAPRIIEEIRDRSGLLVERRPGYFAFSHLTFQEYLTALALAQSPQSKWADRLVARHDDAWWQEVIVLAAGMPGVDAGALIVALLKKGGAGVFVAAHCLETAIEVPLNVREQVEESIARELPPRTSGDIVYLSDWGTLAAPILCRILASREVSAEEAVNSIRLLEHSQHELAIPTLVQLIDDVRIPPESLSTAVGDYALNALSNWATRSSLARRALLTSMKRLPDRRLATIRKLLAKIATLSVHQFPLLAEQISQARSILDAIDQRLKVRSRDKPRSKRGVRSG